MQVEIIGSKLALYAQARLNLLRKDVGYGKGLRGKQSAIPLSSSGDKLLNHICMPELVSLHLPQHFHCSTVHVGVYGVIPFSMSVDFVCVWYNSLKSLDTCCSLFASVNPNLPFSFNNGSYFNILDFAMWKNKVSQILNGEKCHCNNCLKCSLPDSHKCFGRQSDSAKSLLLLFFA